MSCKFIIQIYYLLIIIVELVSSNLGVVQRILWNARHKWYNLGLELEIDEVTLEVIKLDNENCDDCFRKMLSCYLKKTNRSWEAVVKALRQPSVHCKKVASDIVKKCNIPLTGNPHAGSGL